MTATTLKQTEGVLDGYDAPHGLSAEALPFVDAAWQRIEGFTAWRWPERSIEWIAEGPGDWQPPLTPATIATTKSWTGTAWDTVELQASALGGYQLPGCGPYQFGGTAGDNTEPPAAVIEAVRRLAEHFAAIGVDRAGLRSENVAGVWQGEYDSRAMARALQDSGAADLLRTYRRA